MDKLKPITVRKGPGLGHNAVAVQTLNGDPYKLWSLYENEGHIHLATCDDVDVLPTNWKVIDTLDLDASETAIVFDGEWQWHKDEGVWKLHTEETPWLFWVNSYGVLKAQKYGDDHIEDLAIGAYGLSAVRAWKNQTMPTLDQGIIVSYLQLGGLFYRNYCLQDYGETIWEPPREIVYPADTLVSKASVFLLNDYRVGFAVEDTLGKVHWIISTRNWAGMASPSDNITAGIVNVKFEVFPIKYHNFICDEHITTGVTDVFLNVAEVIYPAAVSADNGDKEQETIWMYVNHAIISDITQAAHAFTITDSIGVVYDIIAVEFDRDRLTVIFYTENFGGAAGDMTIAYNRNSYALYAQNQGSLFAFESFSLTFTPNLVPPEGHTLENITAKISPVLNVTQVSYHDSHTTPENLQTSITDINITVTQVGYNPL